MVLLRCVCILCAHACVRVRACVRACVCVCVCACQGAIAVRNTHIIVGNTHTSQARLLTVSHSHSQRGETVLLAPRGARSFLAVPSAPPRPPPLLSVSISICPPISLSDPSPHIPTGRSWLHHRHHPLPQAAASKPAGHRLREWRGLRAARRWWWRRSWWSGWL